MTLTVTEFAIKRCLYVYGVKCRSNVEVRTDSYAISALVLIGPVKLRSPEWQKALRFTQKGGENPKDESICC